MVTSWCLCSKFMHWNKQCVLAAEIAFNSNRSGSLEFSGDSTFSIARANTALLFGWGRESQCYRNIPYCAEPGLLTIIPYFGVVDEPRRKHQMQQLSLVAATVQTVNRSTEKTIIGLFTVRLKWGVRCVMLTCVWHSAIFRKPSTHSWRARAFCARNFNMSPLAQLMVNVLESSSLGHTTAPAKCSWIQKIWYFTSVFGLKIHFLTCHLGVLPLMFGSAESSVTLSHRK